MIGGRACLLLIALAAAGMGNGPVAGDGLRAKMRELLDAEAVQLTELANREKAAMRPDEARAIRDLIEPIPPRDGPWRFVPLPELVPAESLRSVPPGGDDAAAIRRRTATSLFELARLAAGTGTGQFGVATECLREAVQRDPDQPEVRRLLGYVEHEGGWATPEAVRDLKAGRVPHPVFGWVPGDWLPHLENGELPAPTRRGSPVRWLPARAADEMRSEMSRGWVITTHHFRITTNVPLAEAISFGRKLEAVRECFFVLFADVIGRERLPLAERFRDPKQQATAGKSLHDVWYFASREEYNGFFRSIGRDETASLGLYMPKSESVRLLIDGKTPPPRSYFFRDELQNFVGLSSEATMFHEASHQLLFETAGPSRWKENQGNYWIWEGLGTYFETIAPQPDGSYLIGSRAGPRLREAREAAARGRFRSIGDLAALSELLFKNAQRVHTNYAQSMALVVFLMHAENGRWREAFLDYVADAYRGRYRPGSSAKPLEERLGGEDLDARLRRFVREVPDP